MIELNANDEQNKKPKCAVPYKGENDAEQLVNNGNEILSC